MKKINTGRFKKKSYFFQLQTFYR